MTKHYHVRGIPAEDWAIVRAQAGRRLAAGVRALIHAWAAGRLDPLADLSESAAYGRLGGLRRAARLTAKRRADIARRAGQASARSRAAARAARTATGPAAIAESEEPR